MVGYFSIWNTLMSRVEGAMHLQLADGHSHSPESQTSPEHILASDSDSARTIATLQRENALLRGLLDAKEGHESNSLGPLATQQEGAEQVEVRCERACMCQCAWVSACVPVCVCARTHARDACSEVQRSGAAAQRRGLQAFVVTLRSRESR